MRHYTCLCCKHHLRADFEPEQCPRCGVNACMVLDEPEEWAALKRDYCERFGRITALVRRMGRRN